jgi:hypothetical protein
MSRKIHPKKAAAEAPFKKIPATDEQQTITFTVAFYSGAGGIYFHGEGIPDNQYVSSAMAKKTFSVMQSAGHQIVTVAGSAPSGGKVTVAVTEGARVLSPAADNVFDKMTFSGFIVYDC